MAAYEHYLAEVWCLSWRLYVSLCAQRQVLRENVSTLLNIRQYQWVTSQHTFAPHTSGPLHRSFLLIHRLSIFFPFSPLPFPITLFINTSPSLSLSLYIYIFIYTLFIPDLGQILGMPGFLARFWARFLTRFCAGFGDQKIQCTVLQGQTNTVVQSQKKQ